MELKDAVILGLGALAGMEIVKRMQAGELTPVGAAVGSVGGVLLADMLSKEILK